MGYELLSKMRDQTGDMLSFLERVVMYDSPSSAPELTDRLAKFLFESLRDTGMSAELLSRPGVGKHVLARLGEGDEPPVLILGHMDTVWTPDETSRRPFRVIGDRAYGPGINDMKAGITQSIFALKHLAKEPGALKRPVTLFLNSDEEVQSKTSRAIIEDLARQSCCVFVLEPSLGGSLVTARKGSGRFYIKAKGKSARAGSGHHLGVNAIRELSRHVLALEDLTDYAAGTTVNVGVFNGGTKANVVPAEAQIEMSCRVASAKEQERITRSILDAKPFAPGAEIEAWGGFDRPIFECSPAVQQLFLKAQAIGQRLGLTFGQAMSGGASDGNFTARMGVPTLDGLGAVGAGSHAVDEYIEIPGLAERTSLLIRLIQEV